MWLVLKAHCTLEHGIWCSAGVQLKVHEPTVKLMQEHYAKSGKEVNAARLRMATLPQGAEVSLKPYTSFADQKIV